MKQVTICACLLSTALTAFAGSPEIILGRDSAELIESLAHCTAEFSEAAKLGPRVGSIRIEQSSATTKVSTLTFQAGGFIGGRPFHDVAVLKISKTRASEANLAPSQPVSYDYACELTR